MDIIYILHNIIYKCTKQYVEHYIVPYEASECTGPHPQPTAYSHALDIEQSTVFKQAEMRDRVQLCRKHLLKATLLGPHFFAKDINTVTL